MTLTGDTMTDTEAIDALVSKAREAADSWTLSREEARWVAEESIRRSALPDYVVSPDLHKELQARRPGRWPSAREVGAIVRAVLATLPTPAPSPASSK